MEDPTRDITAVIKSLTQGSREEQERTINTHFLPNAYFIHPLCRVPPFAFGGIDTSSAKSLGSGKKGSRQQQQQQAVASPDPDGKQGPLNSRYLVQLVYQWYKILSPQIDIVVDSAAFDAKAGLLYVTMRQTFTIWVVPLSLWQAKVKLVTVLELAELPAAASDGKKKKKQQQQGGSSTEESQGQINGTHADEGPAEVKLEGEDGETMPSFAAVAAPGPTPEHHNTTFHPSTMVNGDGGSHDDEDDSGGAREEEEKKVYYIKGQEDHYQVDQWLKFISPFGPLWFLFQLFATLLCTLGVAALWPITVVVDSRKQKQGQENRGRKGSKEKRG